MGSETLYLPPEIITNILKRLTVKSLIQFQCVCKDWKNLIKTPSFFAEHLQQSSHQNPSLLLFQWDRSGNPLCWCLRLLDCGMRVREIEKAPFINSLARTRIVGSCNGLLCVETNQYEKSPPSLSLWNPATTTFRDVPRTITADYYFDSDYCVTGFGFSPVVNDYKIVRIYAADCYVNRVEVFSLSGESWKGIDIRNLKGVLLDYETVTANGAIFWIGLDLRLYEEGENNIEVEEGEYDVRVIVSFDIAKEVFTLMPNPRLGYGTPIKLTVYENKLAMLCDIGKGNDETSDLIELWVLDEGKCTSGETWSWTRRYAGSPFPCPRSHYFLSTIHSMTIWRNEIILYKTDSKEDNEKVGRNVLYMMNLTTNEVKRFVIPYCGPIHSIYNYVESLVSVGWQIF